MSVFSDLYGEIHDADDAEKAIVATLDDFLPGYLAAVEDAKGLQPGELLLPRGLIAISEIDPSRLDEQLPGIVVASPGEASAAPPQKDQAGVYRQSWLIEVGIAVRASTHIQARRLASAYLAAIKLIIVQNRSLGDRVEQAIWAGGDGHQAGPITADDQMAVYVTGVHVTLRNVASSRKGPDTPPDDPFNPVPVLPPLTTVIPPTVEVEPLP